MSKTVFLINFAHPTSIAVARKLKDKGVKIAYCNGRRDDYEQFCKDSIHDDTIFHEAFDAVKNKPPAGIDTTKFEPLGREMIEKLYPYEGQVFSMIGRADFSDSPLAKKKDIYYQYITFWRGMIKKLRPDVIVFASIPHSGVSYTLYGMAKVLGVRVVILDEINIATRTVCIDDHQTGFLKLDHYQKNNEKQYTVDDLSDDLRDYYCRQLDPNVDSTPVDFKIGLNKKAPLGIPTLSKIISHLIRFTLFKVTYQYLLMMFTKGHQEGILGQNLTGIQYKLVFTRRNKVNKFLQKEYERLETKFDPAKKFIYIPLNIQPEKTTCPMGGVFDNQIAMIRLIASCLPDGWAIYIKENPQQWLAANIGSYLYRYPGYYEEIAKIKNTHFVPITTSTYDLINKSQAVATVTGTAGWEAILRSKPVLVFGYVWYMYCNGVFRVEDMISCQKAMQKIAEGYKPSQQKIINYLFALDKNSIRARYAGMYEQDTISHEDNIDALAEALYHTINYDFNYAK